ncbi:NACHT domain-containing protein [Leptolyngbya sp. ST-U4]|uniref:NACHT domain-containing protein n=1 Tax=Leptolyngbya sp. ST-U4 TaxID=2933912 RepID=UPI0032988E64
MTIGLDALLPEAAKALTGLVIKTGWEMGNVRLDERVKQSIFSASGKYVRNYRDRHGILKVLGMQKPVSLESVYVAVQFLDEFGITDFNSIEELEQAYRESNQRKFRMRREPQKRSGLEIANQTQYLMVLGGPGMGKSTFLRKMGLEALKGKQNEGFQHQCMPVFIELKNFRSGDIDIKAAIVSELETCGFPDPGRIMEQALKQGKLLVLLDGLDEVPSDRTNDVITHIQNFVDCYSENRFIASCRIAAYRHNFRRFTDVAIADFDDEQIQGFIINWFQGNPQRGQECWKKLSSKDYAAAKELTHTPLLLTLVCLLYQRAGQFPTNRATLYERALRVLLEEWAGEKGIPQESVYKGLDTRRKELMLGEIAHNAFQEDRLFLQKREIAGEIERILADMLPDQHSIDGAAVLRSIEVQHGLLVERVTDIYSFSHLTVQEFLTAQYISDDNDKIHELVEQHLTDERWREVFLLLAGLKRADKLLVKMYEQTQTFIQSRKVKALLHWADEITLNSQGDYHPAAKRATAICLALELARTLAFALDRDLALDINLDIAFELARILDRDRDIALFLDIARMLDRDIAQLLDKLQILTVNITPFINELGSLRRTPPGAGELIRQPHKLWLHALKLTPKMVQLTKEEITELITYLKANLLIVNCKEAAVQVTQSTWKSLSHELLRG